jgi:hypothetical protein
MYTCFFLFQIETFLNCCFMLIFTLTDIFWSLLAWIDHHPEINILPAGAKILEHLCSTIQQYINYIAPWKGHVNEMGLSIFDVNRFGKTFSILDSSSKEIFPAASYCTLNSLVSFQRNISYFPRTGVKDSFKKKNWTFFKRLAKITDEKDRKLPFLGNW